MKAERMLLHLVAIPAAKEYCREFGLKVDTDKIATKLWDAIESLEIREEDFGMLNGSDAAEELKRTGDELPKSAAAVGGLMLRGRLCRDFTRAIERACDESVIEQSTSHMEKPAGRYPDYLMRGFNRN